jgi:hypothetical protein
LHERVHGRPIDPRRKFVYIPIGLVALVLIIILLIYLL